MANMKNRRKQLGLTQEKLAEICSTDPCYIRQIEIGHRFPSLEYIERIASALNIAPYLLFYDAANAESGSAFTMPENQKQELKAMLINNATQICSIIDERY